MHDLGGALDLHPLAEEAVVDARRSRRAGRARGASPSSRSRGCSRRRWPSSSTSHAIGDIAGVPSRGVRRDHAVMVRRTNSSASAMSMVLQPRAGRARACRPTRTSHRSTLRSAKRTMPSGSITNTDRFTAMSLPPPHAVQLDHLLVGVGEQREVEAALLPAHARGCRRPAARCRAAPRRSPRTCEKSSRYEHIWRVQPGVLSPG